MSGNSTATTRSRSLVRALEWHKASPNFRAVRLDDDTLGAAMDPFLGIDHFAMSGPTFPPHPHAGFSAVTYLLPESTVGMRNRDSFGDHSLISPGGLHWTTAGSGMLHEEVPAITGQVAEGLQIFVNLPAANKLDRPRVHHAEPGDVPVVAASGSSVRVVAGSYGGVEAPSFSPTSATILDATLEPGAAMDWHSTDQVGIFVYVLSGAGQVHAGDEVRRVETRQICVFPAQQRHVVVTAETPLRLVLFGGRPLGETIARHGPFAMSDQTQLADAVARFRTGRMGLLHPMT